jgi:hypothetical protein
MVESLPEEMLAAYTRLDLKELLAESTEFTCRNECDSLDDNRVLIVRIDELPMLLALEFERVSPGLVNVA